MTSSQTIKCSKCGNTDFESVDEDNFKIKFFVCSSCRTPIAYRDNEIIEKLNFLINEIKEINAV